MIRRIVAVVLLAGLTLPLFGDFASLARAIDSQQGVRRVWIPFLGVARAVVRIAQPEGVRDFQLVTFRNAGKVDARTVQSIMQSKVGPGFQPLVQVWSRKSNDWSFIYAKPYDDGNRVELIVLAHDGDETVLVRVDVDAGVVAREIGRKPRNVTVVAGR